MFTHFYSCHCLVFVFTNQCFSEITVHTVLKKGFYHNKALIGFLHFY